MNRTSISIAGKKLFDPAKYLDTAEAIATYMTESLDTCDPDFVTDALDVIARAKAANPSHLQ
jgi:probable addiction module antidote protein